jgi:hypothetical protein
LLFKGAERLFYAWQKAVVGLEMGVVKINVLTSLVFEWQHCSASLQVI